MPPILFKLDELHLNGGRKLGVGPLTPFALNGPPTRLLIVGVTRDGTGTPIGSCVVTLYRTSDDAVMSELTSDATTGAYEFSVGQGTGYYIVAYKAGAPDLSGTTVNTLSGIV